MTTDERIEALVQRVDELERQFDELLRVFSGAGKMTAAQRQAVRRKMAARARAAKPVGTGSGAVRTKKTKRKLNRERRG